ncbi:MAG: AbiTii domain-containing protein [Candidatus Scalindua sp.]
MSRIVADLQRDALDSSIRVSDLLRKALVVSHKLNLEEFGTWIQHELDGYNEDVDIPEYRIMYGEIKGWNPYRGWIPVLFGDADEAELLSRRKNGQSIAELESLSANKEAKLHMPFLPEVQTRLASNMRVPMQVTLFVPNTSITRIIDSVRTIVLNWALKLEDDGVLGEDFSFTSKEKKAAARSAQNITNYFYAPVRNAQMQQGGSQNVQVGSANNLDLSAIEDLLVKMNAQLDEMGLSSKARQELESEIETIRAQEKSPKPKTSIIRESLRSIRTVLENAGCAIAEQLLIELAKHII